MHAAQRAGDARAGEADIDTAGTAGVAPVPSATEHDSARDAAVAVGESVALEDRRRNTSMSLALALLAAIALVAALYLARAFFVPLLIGILGSYALRPVVDWLEAHFIPRPPGAALGLLARGGGL